MTQSADWFPGKVALVTGAGLGIGRGIAHRLAHEGVAVAVTGRSKERMEHIAGEVRAAGGQALAIGMDVTIPADCQRAVAATLDRFGRLDYLVNSAGTRVFGNVADLPVAQWDDVIAVQLTGTFLCCQAAIDSIVEARGRIVNLSSMFAYQGRPNGSPYAAAKAGVVALTKVLASELAPHVNVNALAPGFVETERFHVGKTAAEVERQRSDRAAEILLGRVGTPEDCAEATLFLLGPGSSWITGQVLHVNGGNYLP